MAAPLLMDLDALLDRLDKTGAKNHIERPPLPWRREERLTECKLQADSYETWTRDEAVAVAKKLGKTRFAMVTCVTCFQTAERHITFDQHPAACLSRYVEHAGWRRPPEHDQINAELRALAALAEAHREEFDSYIAGLAETADLGAKRAAKRYRRQAFGS